MATTKKPPGAVGPAAGSAGATPQPAIQPRLFNVTRSAAYLGCKPWFIKSRIWDGSIRALKFGHTWLIDQADLDDFVEREKAKVS